jgi:hypothetical protein
VADWTQQSVAIPDGAATVQLRWLFGTDTGTQREGWYLDDFRLLALVPPPGLEPVTDLQIQTQNGAIVLTWGATQGAAGYRIYSSSQPWDPNPVLLAEVAAPGWQEPAGLGQKFYVVRAFN